MPSVTSLVRRCLRRREPMLLSAIVLLTHGATVDVGELSSQAIIFVLLGLLCTGLALRAPERGAASSTAWTVAVAACAATAVVIGQQEDSAAAVAAGALLIPCCTGVVVLRGRMRAFATLLSAACVAALTALIWHRGTSIDVDQSLQHAGAALLQLHNPYSTTFITPDEIVPKLFVARSVHFQYLPGAALVAALGSLLGDVRVMNALAMTALLAAVYLLARQAAPGARRMHVLAMCLAVPMTALMVTFAWIDVFSVAGFAGWIALRRRHRRWAVACLAASLLFKPTILVALLPALLWSRAARRDAVFASLAAVVVLLPFVIITGPLPLYQDIIGVQAQLGFRTDGLTFSAWVFNLTGRMTPAWIALPAAGLLAAFSLSRRPRTLADVLLSGAFLSTALFLLAKWAFLNYYFMPAWLLVLALAARGLAFEAEEEITLPLQRWSTRLVRRRQTSTAASGLGASTGVPAIVS